METIHCGMIYTTFMTNRLGFKSILRLFRKLFRAKLFLTSCIITIIVVGIYSAGYHSGQKRQESTDAKKIDEVTKTFRLAPVGINQFSAGPMPVYSAGKIVHVSDKTITIADPLDNRTTYAINDHVNISDPKGTKVERSRLKKNQRVVITGMVKPDGTKLIQHISIKD